MAMKQFATETFAQDRTGILGDFPVPLADGVYIESEVLLDGAPVGPACNKLYIATFEEDNLDGMTDDQKNSYIMAAAEAAGA